MFAFSRLLLLRPRNIMFTPPPLARRSGKFKCKHCGTRWESSNVWVTKTTQKVYQGESCEQCGATNKPFYVGRHTEETIFNRARTPHPVKPGASTSRTGKRLNFSRYDWRVQKGRR